MLGRSAPRKPRRTRVDGRPGRVITPLPRSTSALPASNCGLTSSTSSPADRHTAISGGKAPNDRDERQVGDDQIDRAADRDRVEVADVESLEDRDPLVVADLRMQLPVADVDRHHVGGAALQQAVGEPARRCTGVEHPQAR